MLHFLVWVKPLMRTWKVTLSTSTMNFPKVGVQLDRLVTILNVFSHSSRLLWSLSSFSLAFAIRILLSQTLERN